MAFTDAVKNAMLDLVDETGGTVAITTVSLHTADPGTTGTSELVGGSYARQSVTWGAAASGVKSNTGALVFQVPAGTTVTHVGGWDGVTFRGGGALGASQAFGTAGSYTINAGDLDASI